MRSALRALLLASAALTAATGAVHAERGPRVAAHRVAEADLAGVTDAALAKVRRAEGTRAALIATRTELAVRYQTQLAEIDRLKQQRASWRRDRQLRGKLSTSLETAKKLDAASASLAAVEAQLVRLRRAFVVAADAELAAGVAAARARTVRAARAEAAAKIAPKKAKKIVLPDDEIDLAADPEELDQQAAALRDSETELGRQIASLERQAARFQKQADLRKEHARAGELASRDDSQPRRTAGSGGGRYDADSAGAPEAGQDDGAGGGVPTSDPGSGGGFEGDPAVVLSDVVDGDTVDALRKAERSSDPSVKAAAAERARAQVARRLAALKARRQEIEKRARALRE